MRRSPLGWWAGAGAVGMSTVLALRLFPLPEGPQSTICFVRRFTGWSCPGCGMTRAMAALAAADWPAAWRFHPLSFLVAAELLAAWLLWGVWASSGRPPISRRTVNAALLANAVALLVVWVARWSTGMLPP